MSAIVLILALTIIIASLYGIISPTGYVQFSRRLIARMGIWGVATTRLILALSLWFSADESSTPLAFKALALVVLLGALSIPFIGLNRIEEMIQWSSRQSPWFLRSTCSLGVGLGAFLGWSILSAPNL